jgi:hypothetical protein
LFPVTYRLAQTDARQEATALAMEGDGPWSVEGEAAWGPFAAPSNIEIFLSQ